MLIPRQLVRLISIALSIGVAMCAATAAQASVIFSNIDQPYGAWTSSSGLLGMEFIPTRSGTLQSISLPLGVLGHIGQPHQASVYLYSGPQTGLLESWNIDVTNGLSAPDALNTVLANTPIDIVQGSAYWVFLSNPGYFTDGGVAWGWDTSPSGTHYPSYGGGGGGYEYPGSPWNNQFGLLVTSAVPEPATWAMMVLGFGFVGFSLRNGRRRRQNVLLS